MYNMEPTLHDYHWYTVEMCEYNAVLQYIDGVFYNGLAEYSQGEIGCILSDLGDLFNEADDDETI